MADYFPYQKYSCLEAYYEVIPSITNYYFGVRYENGFELNIQASNSVIHEANFPLYVLSHLTVTINITTRYT